MSLTTEQRQTLKALVNAERKAWRAIARGTEADACTIKGQEGVNYLAWCAAADAEYAFRAAHEADIALDSRRWA